MTRRKNKRSYGWPTCVSKEIEISTKRKKNVFTCVGGPMFAVNCGDFKHCFSVVLCGSLRPQKQSNNRYRCSKERKAATTQHSRAPARRSGLLLLEHRQPSVEVVLRRLRGLTLRGAVSVSNRIRVHPTQQKQWSSQTTHL